MSVPTWTERPMPLSITLAIDEQDLPAILIGLRLYASEEEDAGIYHSRSLGKNDLLASLRRIRAIIVAQRDAQLASRAVADEGV